MTSPRKKGAQLLHRLMLPVGALRLKVPEDFWVEWKRPRDQKRFSLKKVESRAINATPIMCKHKARRTVYGT